MKDLEARTRRLLRIYPSAYRAERGDEIIATVLDAADARGRVSRHELADVMVHGVQMRLGLTADRFGGRVMDEAGQPGMFMGAAVSLFLFIWGDWLPVARTPYHLAGFGPFLTTGPAIYGIWTLATATVALRPQWLRPAAALCIATTALMWFIGKFFFTSPNFWQLLLLIGLAVPGALAPSTEVSRRRVPASLLAGAATFAIMWWLGGVDSLNPPVFHHSLQFSFYTFGNYFVAHNLPWLAGAILLASIVLLVSHQFERAGALIVLTAPLLAVAAGSLRGADAVTVLHRGAFMAAGVLALLIPVAWLALAWTLDLRSGVGDHADRV
jgi:hypothetical protein